MNIIELHKINKFFGEGENRVHILKDVTFSVSDGDFVAIIGQSVVPILASDTPETLAARLLPYEHALYPKCVRAVALGEVRLENGRAVMSDEVARSLAVFPTE